jgi:predicted helicase
LGLSFKERGSGDLKKTVGAEDIFHYVYALLHSPGYRTRYAEFLRKDFPRIAVVSDRKVFASLVEKGKQLNSLHFLKLPELEDFVTEFPEKGNNVIERLTFMPDKERVWINPKQYFDGVSEEAWHFQIGGYRVCEKWLKDRKDETLSYDDLQHWQRIVLAVNRTMQIMEEIDELIPTWPLK